MSNNNNSNNSNNNNGNGNNNGKSQKDLLKEEIEDIVENINKEDFYGLGVLTDYEELFTSVQTYVKEYGDSNILLDVNLEKLEDFSEIVNSYKYYFEQVVNTMKKISSVDDTYYLAKLVDALETFKSFKECILDFKKQVTGESVLNIPDSLSFSNQKLSQIESEIESITDILEYFSLDSNNVDNVNISDMDLNDETKNKITETTNKVDDWLDMIRSGNPIQIDDDDVIQDTNDIIDNFEQHNNKMKQSLSKLSSILNIWSNNLN